MPPETCQYLYGGSWNLIRSNPDEDLWEPLLLAIEERRVIPVIGRDLLTITQGGRQLLLYAWLAERLAQMLRLDMATIPGPPTLEAVATRHVSSAGDPRQISTSSSPCCCAMPARSPC